MIFHLSRRTGDFAFWVPQPHVLLLWTASLPAKVCPQATTDRLSGTACACAQHERVRVHVFVGAPACMDIFVQCMCQGQLFLLFLSRASGKSPSSLSKHSFLRGTAIDCRCSLPLINPSQRRSAQSESSVAENFCLFNFSAGSLELVCWNCWI